MRRAGPLARTLAKLRLRRDAERGGRGGPCRAPHSLTRPNAPSVMARQRYPRRMPMPSSRLIRLACVLPIVAVVVGAWLAVEAPGPGQEAQDRRRLRLHGPAGRRRLRAARARRQDHDRQLRQEGRGRRLRDRGALRRRAEQAGRRDQRVGAPDRAGEGRHAAGLLLLGPVRAGGRAGRAAAQVHVDHHLHLLGGAGEPQSEVRVPRAAERAAVRPDVDRLRGPERQGQAGQGAQGPARGHHPRGRRLRRGRLARATRKGPRRPASTSC